MYMLSEDAGDFSVKNRKGWVAGVSGLLRSSQMLVLLDIHAAINGHGTNEGLMGSWFHPVAPGYYMQPVDKWRSLEQVPTLWITKMPVKAGIQM